MHLTHVKITLSKRPFTACLVRFRSSKMGKILNFIDRMTDGLSGLPLCRQGQGQIEGVNPPNPNTELPLPVQNTSIPEAFLRALPQKIIVVKKLSDSRGC
jgi:hypothetical protein